jgi:hypothetical protein
VVHGPQVGRCVVCGEMTDPFSNATCLQCGGVYHLALRQDVPAKDCGQVWINDEFQTLEYACDACLGRAEPARDETAGEREPRGYARRQGVRAADVLRQKRGERPRRPR